MSEPVPSFETVLESIVRRVVREEIEKVSSQNGHDELLTPEELASRMKLPLSWVYEQSRQDKIPTHRLGRYLSFNFAEVLASQKKKKDAD